MRCSPTRRTGCSTWWASCSASRERAADESPKFGLRLRLLASLGSRFQRLRETARDATIRQTHQYRLIAREIGSRLAARGVIDSPDDVFYLVRDELKNPPADAKAVVARRRAERKRLETQRPPLNFVGEWTPDAGTDTELMPGEIAARDRRFGRPGQGYGPGADGRFHGRAGTG